MIVLDTGVLSAAFRRRKGPPSTAAAELKRLIVKKEPLSVPGIVLQEVLSGIRAPTQFAWVKQRVVGFEILLADEDAHIHAAEINNTCRKAGIAANAIDCLIAAQALRVHGTLFTVDVDFDYIAPFCRLPLYVQVEESGGSD